MAGTDLPPKKLWGDIVALTEWKMSTHNWSEDKARSWAKGFTMVGRKQ